jgi:hypothetical protein
LQQSCNGQTYTSEGISSLKVGERVRFPHALPYETTFVDAHRDDGKRFVVRADEILTGFMELEAAIRGCGDFA